MRYRGRVIIKKVDNHGNKIKGSLKDWIKKHPDTLYFDSMIEYEVWKYMETQQLNYTYQPSLMLFDRAETTEFKNGKIKEYTQRKISYTPDFYLHKFDTYIEVKGYTDPLFKLRWKLFKLAGHTGYIVYSIAELKTLIKELNETK